MDSTLTPLIYELLETSFLLLGEEYGREIDVWACGVITSVLSVHHFRCFPGVVFGYQILGGKGLTD